MVSSRKVLIIGDRGYLGAAFSSYFSKTWDLLLNSELSTDRRFDSASSLVDMINNLTELDIELVLFCAGLNQSACLNQNPDLINVNWPFRVAQSVLMTTNTRIIFFSSIHAFKMDKHKKYSGIIDIDDIADGPYGKSKAKMEIALDQLVSSQESKNRILILRLSNVFGIDKAANKKGSGLAINSFLYALRSGERSLLLDPHASRSLVPLSMLIDLIAKLKDQDWNYSLLNVGTEHFFYLRSLHDIIFGRSTRLERDARYIFLYSAGAPMITDDNIYESLLSEVESSETRL